MKSKNSPNNRGGDESHSMGRNANKELEIIYENDFVTQITRKIQQPKKGRFRDSGNTTQMHFSSKHNSRGENIGKGRQQRIESQCELGKFKQNMLLEFYDWPKIETSAVHASSLRNTTI